jgi:hypothetical protein
VRTFLKSTPSFKFHRNVAVRAESGELPLSALHLIHRSSLTKAEALDTVGMNFLYA